jgi:hypothetical protein
MRERLPQSGVSIEAGVSGLTLFFIECMGKLSLLAFLLVFSVTGCMKTNGEGPGEGDCHRQDSTAQLRTNSRAFASVTGGPGIVGVTFWSGIGTRRTTNGEDEMIALQSALATSTKGYHLQAGDADQQFALPDSLPVHLNVYAHSAPAGASQSFGLNLPAGTWLWNKTGYSHAILLDANGAAVDSIGFYH